MCIHKTIQTQYKTNSLYTVQNYDHNEAKQ